MMLALALLVGACAQPRPTPPPQPVKPEATEVVALINLGDSRLAQGRAALAVDAYRAALQQKPKRELASRAMYGLAKALGQDGRHQASLDWALRLLAFDPFARQASDAELLAAEQEQKLGQNQRSATRLKRIINHPAKPLNWEQRLKAHRMLAEALISLGRIKEALNTYVELAKEGGPETLETVADKLARTAGRLAPYDIKPLLTAPNPPQIRTALLVGLASANLREGNTAQAESTLNELRGMAHAEPFMDQIRELERQIAQARMVRPSSVGVILPLSGRYSAHGREVLAAVELGLGLFSTQGGGQIKLFIEDSKSNPLEAAEAVTKLVTKQRVMAIIGPMGAATSLAAARRAQELKTPLITITQLEGATRAGDYIFQNFFTPEEQVDALLKAIMAEKGLTKVAVLAPDSAYGKGFATLMAKGVEQRGGVLVRTIYFNPKLTDYADEIKRLVHLPPGNYRPGHPESPKPKIDFEALFVPDSPSRVGMIAPQLTYFDIVDVTLLGTNLWHNPRLLNLAGRYVENSLFPDAFAADSGQPLVREFVRQFESTLDRPPNVLDAHAYDAALVVRRLLKSPNPPRTRIQMKNALSELRLAPGVCGELSMGPDRRLKKELTLYTVKNGRFKLYDPSEMEFDDPLNPNDVFEERNLGVNQSAPPSETNVEELTTVNEAPAGSILH
jgi:ABC-type branched-subunit amino acid transport system substrate-binding protein